MKKNMYLVSVWICVFCVLFAVAQECPSFVPEEERRNCYPWPDASEATCQDRGCVWCETETPDIPFCFMNDDACPSTIDETDRVDCHPEPGVNRAACLARGCAYCPTTTSGIPWCFEDAVVNQGGEECPADIPDEERIDCAPSVALSKEQCVSKGCYYCESTTDSVPWCFASREHGYVVIGDPTETPKGYTATLQRVNYPSWFGSDINELQVDVEYQEDYRLRVKIFDPNNARYEVPVVNIPSPDSKAPNPLYKVRFVNSPSFGLIVERPSGEVLFDMSMGGFQFADQFLQFSTRLPSSNVYGFGETEHPTLRHNLNWKSWGMWGRDEPVAPVNGYGVHPFYTALDNNNNLMGALVLNSNAQEVSFMPAPGLVYRTLGGVLDIYFFLGPEPEQVMQQYHEAIGLPVMPVYWSLGFHLSRYGYNEMSNMQAAVDRTKQYDIPLDCLYGDIDTFERNLDFTYDQERFAGLPEYVLFLKELGTKFVTILDPPISIGEPRGSYPPFDDGDAADVWTKESDGVTNAEAQAWPEDNVYFPDYWSDEAQAWWIEQCINYHDTLQYDGIWLDMNEPASFADGSVKGCYNNMINLPLFKPSSIMGEQLQEKTLCPDYLTVHGNHYDTHNLYGVGHVVPTIPAVQEATGNRGFVITRSSFPGTGRLSGHWLGDNAADWVDVKYSIVGCLEFNMFGIPYVGADICGFFGDSYEGLCLRWMELGAFYTFSRNHNGLGWADHDPGTWQSVGEASKKAMDVRYTLLPYLYTLFHNVHIKGGTVMRPVFHEFASDENTHDLDEQFLWGPAVLISPVLEDDTTTKFCYFPATRWFDYYSGAEEALTGDFVTIDVPLDTIPVHIRGGFILSTQEPANCTLNSRQNPMGLIVALDDAGSSSGELFWDDGESIDTYEDGNYFQANYSVNQGSLTMEVLNDGYADASTFQLGTVRILGETEISNVQLNGEDYTDWEQIAPSLEILISNLNLPINEVFLLSWT